VTKISETAAVAELPLDGHHPEQCGVCEDYKEQMRGVRRAIRRFGGRP
jgi:hypothetical protein